MEKEMDHVAKEMEARRKYWESRFNIELERQREIRAETKRLEEEIAAKQKQILESQKRKIQQKMQAYRLKHNAPSTSADKAAAIKQMKETIAEKKAEIAEYYNNLRAITNHYQQCLKPEENWQLDFETMKKEIVEMESYIAKKKAELAERKSNAERESTEHAEKMKEMKDLYAVLLEIEAEQKKLLSAKRKPETKLNSPTKVHPPSNGAAGVLLPFDTTASVAPSSLAETLSLLRTLFSKDLDKN